MNLTVSNLSNDLARNNAVFISAQLAKDASRTVNVRINHKIFKCGFLQELERSKIAMSKGLRSFIGTDLGRDVKVEPVSNEYDMDFDISYM